MRYAQSRGHFRQRGQTSAKEVEPGAALVLGGEQL
jgi:hypothetical protein